MPFDFFYGVWHDVQIKECIEKFGPKNRYKPGFQDTTRTQRIELFHEINMAVHRGGKGLEDISYQSPSSGGQQRLLREPEVVHLQDVANLLSVLLPLALIVVFDFPFLVIFYYRKFGTLPSIKYQSLGLLGLLVVLGGLLILIGPEKVFNTLHVWIFPKDHQWFFYYQDSLMSTMMYAPKLFGWIALTWALIASALFLGVNWVCKKIIVK